MAIVKVIELLAEGNSIEDAMTSALQEASKTVKNIKTLYAQDIQGIVENGTISKYRINVKVSFVVSP